MAPTEGALLDLLHTRAAGSRMKTRKNFVVALTSDTAAIALNYKMRFKISIGSLLVVLTNNYYLV